MDASIHIINSTICLQTFATEPVFLFFFSKLNVRNKRETFKNNKNSVSEFIDLLFKSVFRKLLVNIASGSRLFKLTHTNNSVQLFDCRVTKSSASVSLACEDNLAPKARK